MIMAGCGAKFFKYRDKTFILWPNQKYYGDNRIKWVSNLSSIGRSNSYTLWAIEDNSKFYEVNFNDKDWSRGSTEILIELR